MNSDFKDLLHLFNAKSVKYLIVGGYAVIKYAQPRYTGDLDLWIEASKENSLLVFDALKEFGAPVQSLNATDFEAPGFFFQMGVPPSRIDILMSVSGLEFAEAWNHRVPSNVGTDVFYFVSKADLIASKQAAGRPKDLADLAALTHDNEG